MGEHANETTQEPGTAGTSARHASLNRFSSDHEHRHPDESNFFTPQVSKSRFVSCCGSVVLMDESAESVAPLQRLADGLEASEVVAAQEDIDVGSAAFMPRASGS